MTPLAYRDAADVGHEVVVRKTPVGDWEVVDICAGEERVIERLDGRVDGERQAKAVATDYVTAGRFTAPAGRHGGEAIPEGGGADAHSDRRLRSAACATHAGGAALSRQAA